jgi:energy-coupling factor transporter ATP-binding protein EcfA2
MRITKIELKGFRVFHGSYEIDLGKEGRNLLVYGENGSGKTSLYEAINLFLSSRKPLPEFLSNQNIFVETDDNFVKLSLGDGQNSDQAYEWSKDANPFSEPVILSAAKTKGFFDYKSLLDTYFLQRDQEKVNIFNILVRNLISNMQNGITNTPFGEEWAAIEALSKNRMTQRVREQLEKSLAEFQDGLINAIKDLNTCANVILADFDDTIKVEISSPEFVFDSTKKQFTKTEIGLSVTYYKKAIQRHHLFLNEARLSAIALSIYLASILLNPQSDLKILALDDVLIGLDMSNRFPLIKTLQREFIDKGWQVILTTYDRVWYEILCQRLPDPKWARAEFFCGKTDEYDVPIHKNGKGWLEKAQEFLDDGELKAAVIYIRTGYEHIIRNYCNDKKLHVKFRSDGKYESRDFWEVLLPEKVLDQGLIDDVELYRSKILNPQSHAAFVNPIKCEIQDALNTIKQLEQKLENRLKQPQAGNGWIRRRKPQKQNRKQAHKEIYQRVMRRENEPQGSI